MQIIFDEIMPSRAIELIQDVFGNYVSSCCSLRVAMVLTRGVGCTEIL